MATVVQSPQLSALSRHLVHRGLLNDEQALDAEGKCRDGDTQLITYLVQQRLVNPDQLAWCIAQDFSLPLLDLDAVHIDLETARKAGETAIRAHRIVPFYRRGKRLFVAISDPTNFQGLEEIKFNTGLSVEPVICEEHKLTRHLERLIQALDTSIGDLEIESEDLGDLADMEADMEQEHARAAPTDPESDDAVVRFIRKTMLDAVRRGASDIHFEPYEKSFRVRMRVDGILEEVSHPPVALSEKIAARLKVLAEMNVAERRRPQDGRTKLKISRYRSMDFRVSTIPTAWGEKVVLRLLDPANAQLGVAALGFGEDQKQQFLKALERPNGMILVTGPTGSGKTITLYTAMQMLNKPERNISTAEDPVEIRLEGINQLNVHPAINLTFANALRAFLRQDPDVILVGEIRDLETAEIAVKASQTGHLVLSTLHTNDAPKTLTRLRDLGLPLYAIASSVELIIAQRLVRKLCESCRKPLDIPREALEKEGFTGEELDAGVRIYGPQGCDQCNNGYKGRTGIFQVMPMTDEMEQAIMREENEVEITRLAREVGVRDMRRAGLDKVRTGITTLDEVQRVTTD
ncbi:MAG: type IV-A pilus assembly ATPase PilB [Gammaproteobacteria bacterium]|nr:type IV-A pilus assembly ATPase PilB [Gammaproteobacteria bacterium]